MKFNDKQAEGLARFMDTVAASAFIGFVIGATGHSLINIVEIGLLLLACLMLLGIGAFLRREI